jgi:hypothetical protein
LDVAVTLIGTRQDIEVALASEPIELVAPPKASEPWQTNATGLTPAERSPLRTSMLFCFAFFLSIFLT